MVLKVLFSMANLKESRDGPFGSAPSRKRMMIMPMELV